MAEFGPIGDARFMDGRLLTGFQESPAKGIRGSAITEAATMPKDGPVPMATAFSRLQAELDGMAETIRDLTKRLEPVLTQADNSAFPEMEAGAPGSSGLVQAIWMEAGRVEHMRTSLRLLIAALEV